MHESSCCAVMRKMGGKKCPICHKPIKLAIVLRMLRHDARQWWYFQALRKNGSEGVRQAIKLERQSIRNNVRFIRQNISREALTYRTSVIDFPNREIRTRPFDLQPVDEFERSSYTASLSGCHVGIFAAWVHCYAHRIGWKPQPKRFDTV